MREGIEGREAKGCGGERRAGFWEWEGEFTQFEHHHSPVLRHKWPERKSEIIEQVTNAPNNSMTEWDSNFRTQVPSTGWINQNDASTCQRMWPKKNFRVPVSEINEFAEVRRASLHGRWKEHHPPFSPQRTPASGPRPALGQAHNGNRRKVPPRPRSSPWQIFRPCDLPPPWWPAMQCEQLQDLLLTFPGNHGSPSTFKAPNKQLIWYLSITIRIWRMIGEFQFVTFPISIKNKLHA